MTVLSMKPPVILPVLTGAAVLALSLGGCGSSKPKSVVILNTERVELAIQQSIDAQRHVRAQVTCPAGVHQRKGLTFHCTVESRFGTTTFVVRQDDDKGNVSYAAR
jgi:hypothetical protein